MSDIEINGKSLGRIAFEAYRNEVVTSYDDRRIPEWDALDGDMEKAHRGWEIAAAEVARAVRMGAIIEKTMEGPFVPRERPQRWRPVGDFMTRVPVDEEPPVFEPLPPIDEDRVEQARESVPVEADDDTRDDAR